MENHFSPILTTLSSGNITNNLKTNQALVTQLAQIFNFSFHFDEKKMVNPAIQNDFSYYRRVLSRMKSGTAKQKKTKTKVNEEVANKMSFFFAYPTPMMKVLIDTCTKSEQIDNAELVNALSMLANFCVAGLQSKEFNYSSEDQMNIVCMMTGSIILVDHLTQLGAFHKKSPIKIKACITLLKNLNNLDFLLNSLRFSTIHLNEDQTMSEIKKMLL